MEKTTKNNNRNNKMYPASLSNSKNGVFLEAVLEGVTSIVYYSSVYEFTQ